ncbi:hypothetical protein MLD38_000825 [Melastoma candidum]|uniref:Uncharacterized protein n=1 Tax=Melastoma candidum TaxID=119954 RepID=A0ACB9SF94_9MYRT|nr:hypothetical protein MLD38_000825 [Melastoma candidum]
MHRLKLLPIPRWLSDLQWRTSLLLVPPLSLLLLLLFLFSFPSFPPQLSFPSFSPSSSTIPAANSAPLNRSRIAVCLVGGARRFELTGPSIIRGLLRVYPTADLFLHSPLDENSYKFVILNRSPRIASVRIFKPAFINETEPALRVLTARNSPNGIQGLLQYFNLVEGCLTLIKSHQSRHNFTYDWIIRTRVDGYWNARLSRDNFIRGTYVVPPGSTYGGLNDRFGIGDLQTSTVALSRLSLIPLLDSSGYRQLNSETAFRAQLTTNKIPYVTPRLPFCIVSDRRYEFPPSRFGVPVAAMSSKGPLSGTKCRPCKPVCRGQCVEDVMSSLEKGWSWTNWENGTLELCDAHEEWEKGWEEVFDKAAGEKLAKVRRKVKGLGLDGCVREFGELSRKADSWDAPKGEEICRMGLLVEQKG